MEKVLAYIFDTIIASFIIFFAVVIYFGLRTETVMKSLGETITKDFITEVKRDGCFYAADYEKYMEELYLTGALYDICFEHIHPVTEPEYRFRTIEEIIEAQNAAYTGTNTYHYRDVITELPTVNDPINSGSLNTETNESVLAKAENTPADPNHVHTDECYDGHRHSGTNYFIHTHQHDHSCVEYEQILYVYIKCISCGSLSKKLLVTRYWDNESNSVKVGYIVGVDRTCWVCGSSNTTDTLVSGYAYSCGYNIDVDNDGFIDAVGRDRAYQYTVSDPQDKSVKMTYAFGCYAYNNGVSIVPKYTQSGSHDTSDFYSLYTKGIDAYCYVPELYTVRYAWSESDYIALDFKLYMNDGQAVFTVTGGTNISIWDISRFPSITLQELRDLIYDKEKMFMYLKTYAGSTFIPGYENCYCYLYKMSGSTQVCDHTSHNIWYTTCGMEESNSIACHHIITKLAPTHPVQTAATGDPLITTAIATYQDGSKKTIVCETSFSTASVTQNQNVILSYNYMVNGTSYHKECTIAVTVIPRTGTCSYNHTYNLREDGTDPGCPYCREWIRELRILYPTTSAMTITIGTTLPENGVTLYAIYYDGHTETITSGYIDNLDQQYLGTKPVTIGYKGKTVQLEITTVCARMVCEICGYEYERYPDGTNPGCPGCIQKTPVFTGNVLRYDEIFYTDEILSKLYRDGVYSFHLDDTFTISLSNKSGTKARSFLNKLFPSLSDRWFSLNESEKIGLR